MRWNDWQVWRSTTGRMPRQTTDGYSVSRARESALWQAVMLELYGTEWSVQLASMDDDTAAAREAAAGLGGAPAGSPTGPSPERPSSPGSGAGGAPNVPVTPVPTRVTSSPGSGQVTPQSWHSQNPGTPQSLTQRVLQAFRPEAETLDVYSDRVRRQAAALNWRKHP